MKNAQFREHKWRRTFEEAVAAIKQEPVVHADETSHKVAGKKAWMRIALSLGLAVFFARAARSKKIAIEILGDRHIYGYPGDSYAGLI